MVTKILQDKYYMLLCEIKDFNALIDNEPFFDQPVKKTSSLWKTCQNVKKQLLCDRKFIIFFVTPKLL